MDIVKNVINDFENWILKSEIHIIRKDLIPLIKYETNINKSILYLSSYFNISSSIVLEIFSILQAFWFIKGVNIINNSNNQNLNIDYYINSLSFNINTDFETKNYVLINFFKKLSNISIIKNIKNWDFLINWLVRITTLYDLYINNFKSLEDFLDHILINIEFQNNVFWKNYFKLLQNTSWLRLLWLKETKNFSFLENIYVKNFCEILYNNKKYSLFLRILPWYSPFWVMIKVWINFAKKQKNNFLYVINFNIELIDKNIIPVFKIIQNSLNNIWINRDNWDLIEIDETNMNEIKSILTDKEYIKLFSIIEKIAKNNNFLEILIISIISTLNKKYNFKYYQVINPIENLWLQRHNLERSILSLEKSWYNSYTKKFINIWWKLLSNNRVNLKYEDIRKIDDNLTKNISKILFNYL